MEIISDWWAGLSIFGKVVILWLTVAAAGAVYFYRAAKNAPNLPWHD